MKQIIFGIVVLFTIAACSTQKSAIKVEPSVNEGVVEDSVEYGLETFDPKFETWYSMHDSPALYHSQSYYESWNMQYVSAWNSRAMSGNRNSFFENVIEYTPSIDYGFELNHELFYYFQYVEKVLKIRIIQDGPMGL